MSERWKTVVVAALTALATATGVTLTDPTGLATKGPSWTIAEIRELYKSATTTKEGPAYKVFEFSAPEGKQGVCLKLKDADGEGFTYIAANNGELSSSQTPCD